MPGNKRGTTRRWTENDEHRLAAELAERCGDLRTIAKRWGVPYGYMRRIACGERRPRIAALVEQHRECMVRHARNRLAYQLPKAVQKIAELAENDELPGWLQLKACQTIVDLALGKPRGARRRKGLGRPVAAAPEPDSEPAIVLADAIREVKRERRARGWPAE